MAQTSRLGVAALFSFLVYRENPRLPVEFRVMQLAKETSVVSYGFKGTALEEIRKMAEHYRTAVVWNEDPAGIEMSQNILDYHLDHESFDDYLQFACPLTLGRSGADVCRTHPQYFIWPSDRFFIHERPE